MVGLRFPQLPPTIALTCAFKGKAVSPECGQKGNEGLCSRASGKKSRGSFQLGGSCGLPSREGMLRQDPLQSPLGILTLCGMEEMPTGTREGEPGLLTSG